MNAHRTCCLCQRVRAAGGSEYSDENELPAARSEIRPLPPLAESPPRESPRLSLTSSNRTLTRFEMPDSCIVIPYSVLAQAIVFLQCVTTMNCVHSRNSFSTPTNRSMFASSSAASTSSSTQKGLGRLRKMAKSRATQVSVFSPPLRSEMLRGSLPGGRATISMPLSRMSDSLFQHDIGPAAAKQLAEQGLEMFLHRVQRLGEQAAAVGVDFADDGFQRLFRLAQVLVLTRQVRKTRLQLVGLLERIDVHAADIAELAAKLVDFFLDRRALVFGLDGRAFGLLGQLDPVVFAKPILERDALVPQRASIQLLLVEFLFDAGGLGRGAAAIR